MLEYFAWMLLIKCRISQKDIKRFVRLDNSRYFNLVRRRRVDTEPTFSQFAKSSFFECEKPKTRNASFPSERFINRAELTQGIVDLER